MATGQVRTESELLELFKDNVTQDIYPVDLRDFVVTMFFEIASVTGVSSYVYIAYADDAAGTGFTLAFNPLKDYIAIRSTTVEIPAPVVGDFTGLWTKYRGDKGDPGTSILTGAVDPLPGDGDDGDVFLNTTSYELFGPKSGGIWGAGTSLIGNGVASVALINTVANVDTYRMTFTDATFFDYDVTNGLDGADGATGPPGPVQNGVQLGAGANVFKQLDLSNDMEFRSITSISSEISITENVGDIEFEFDWGAANVTLSGFLPNFGSVIGRSPLQLLQLHDGRLYKFKGGLHFTGLGISTPANTTFFTIPGWTFWDTLGVAVIMNNLDNFVQYVPVKIDNTGAVILMQSVSWGLGYYIAFEPITIYA